MTSASGGDSPAAGLSWADEPPWHAMPPDAALAALGATTEGLTAAEATSRLARYGRNEVPLPPAKRRLAVYLSQFRSAFIYLLLAAAAVSAGLGEFGDALFIFAVLQLNAIIGAYQEWQAQTRAEGLRRMVQTWVTVRREGNLRRIDGRQLVPGDVVLVEPGLRLPAGLRLLDSMDLSIDESLLTGESVPVLKDAAVPLADDTPMADRVTLLHAGCTVLAGRGVGVVVATGARTQVGRIAAALASGVQAPPPLIRRMARFTRIVAVAIVAVIAGIVTVELGRGAALGDIFLVAVALAVSAIPEGLPVALTVALSISVGRMAQRNVVVRRLPAVEGLGACTLIASDKTGTLTRNELTIRVLHLPGVGDVTVSGEGFDLAGGLVGGDGPVDEAVAERAGWLALAGALCNEAALEAGDDGRLHAVGDTVDAAFLVLGHKLALDMEELAVERPQQGVIPYEPAKRYAASFNGEPGAITAFVKGAAETILPMCADVDEAAVRQAGDRLAAAGYRVLALASGPVAASDAGALRGLAFIGFVGLIDPLRAEAKDAVAQCRRAGVAVRMVTGDHPLTALAISRELGIATGPEDVVTGRELHSLRDDRTAFDQAVARARLFARIEPLQKLEVVQSLQRAGHFVAVTGDGVNDAPALRAADIGAAMGRSGTDVAREAADLILTDDNFASIVGGIEEGRIAYDNVRKVIYLLISTGAAEIVLFLLSLAAGLPLPLSAVQLLWLNRVPTGILDVARACDNGEPVVRRRRPRPPAQGIFERRMIEQVLLSGVVIGVAGFLFFRWGLAQGWPPAQVSNLLLLLFVLFENAHVFNCRSESRSVLRVPLSHNPFLVIGVVMAQGIHVGAMYVPGLSTVLGIAPVAMGQWLEIAAIALIVVVAMEIYKRLVGWLRPPPPAT